MDNEIKHHPESLEQVKVKFSPYRRMGTKDRIYNKMGAVWAADSKLKK